jgi:hypothetical protein
MKIIEKNNTDFIPIKPLIDKKNTEFIPIKPLKKNFNFKINKPL